MVLNKATPNGGEQKVQRKDDTTSRPAPFSFTEMHPRTRQGWVLYFSGWIQCNLVKASALQMRTLPSLKEKILSSNQWDRDSDQLSGPHAEAILINTETPPENPKSSCAHQGSSPRPRVPPGSPRTLLPHALASVLKIWWEQKYLNIRSAECSRSECQILLPFKLHFSQKRLPGMKITTAARLNLNLL